MEHSRTFFFSSKFPWTRERIHSKFIDHFGARPKKVLQPCSRLITDRSGHIFHIFLTILALRINVLPSVPECTVVKVGIVLW